MFEKHFGMGGEQYDTPGWGADSVVVHSRSFDKIAGQLFIPPKLERFINEVKPDPHGVYILLTALGASEHWGQNRNADAFQEYSLKGEKAPSYIYELAQRRGFRCPVNYGLEVYLKLGGIYRHHDNKDRARSMGRICAVEFNDTMKRGEMIIFVEEAKAPDIVADTRAGRLLPWSMGAHLPFDECLCCHHLARNRSEYCSHCKTMLGQILPDGKRVGVNNPFPGFFDISRVHRPADRSAWSHRKVASFGGVSFADTSIDEILKSTELTQRFLLPKPPMRKVAAKLADMEKHVDLQKKDTKSLGSSPITPELWSNLKRIVDEDQSSSRDLPLSTQSALCASDPCTALRAVTSMGIVLKPHELSTVLDGRPLPSSLEMTKAIPDKLLDALSPSAVGRSMFEPHVVRRIRVVMVRRTPGTDSPKMEKKAGVYAQYLGLISGTDVDELQKVRKDPRVVLASHRDALTAVFFAGPSAGSDLDLLPFLAAVSS